MSLRTCAECSTQYAFELDSCPHCGSSDSAEDQAAGTRRLPMFVTTQCSECGRGPWTVRLTFLLSGLVELPALACFSCGSQVPLPWPPEEEAVSPKITVHGGATNAHGAGVSPAAAVSQPLVVAEDGQGRPTSEPPVFIDAEPYQALPEVMQSAYAVDAVELPVAPAYEGMTLAELRTEAEGRGVPSYGTKAQITERLREADQAQTAENTE